MSFAKHSEIISSQSVTYYTDDQFLMDELDHGEMVALSGKFRLWALYESELSSWECTEMMCWSADLERLAEHVGPKWHASDPTGTLIQFIASTSLRAAQAANVELHRERQSWKD